MKVPIQIFARILISIICYSVNCNTMRNDTTKTWKYGEISENGNFYSAFIQYVWNNSFKYRFVNCKHFWDSRKRWKLMEKGNGKRYASNILSTTKYLTSIRYIYIYILRHIYIWLMHVLIFFLIYFLQLLIKGVFK